MTREQLARRMAGAIARQIMDGTLDMEPPDIRPVIEERIRGAVLAGLLQFGNLACAECNGVAIVARTEE